MFSLDAFAGGFVVQSLLVLWLFERFDLSLSAAGAFFFWSDLAPALSFPAAAASFTSVPRSLAAAASPALAGAMFAASYRSWPLFICGVLKIIYDLLLLAQFRHQKPPEEC